MGKGHLVPAQRSATPAPRATEEQRAFLQERLARFARAAALLSVGLYLALNLAASLNPRAEVRDWYAAAYSVSLFSIAVAGVAIWRLLANKARALRTVEAADAGFVFLIACLMGWIALASPPVQRPELMIITGLDLVLVLRAAFLPSRAIRTALVGALSLLPVVAATFAAHRVEAPRPFLLPPTQYAAIVVVWGALGVATAALTSGVIYTLRKTAHDAQRLGQYTLEDKIGEGGMGVVFRAKHALLRRPTAIKLLHPSVAGELGLVRFEREVQITSSLTHPSTVAIYDYGHTPAGVFYYAMEYIEGLTLQELGSRFGAQPPGRVIHILRQMCGALHEAHQRGLIHRDVKPANAILCERGDLGDVVKVLDFGLARELRKPEVPPGHGDRASVAPASLSASETQAGAISGTPQYLAPEAIQRPAEVDARMDLYALGCVGYFLLTGSEVFPKLTVSEIFAHHVHVVPVPPSKRLHQPALADGTDLEKVILWCLEKDPARRPADARVLSDALATCAAAGSWTEASARAWWREHRATAKRTTRELAGYAPTLAVDTGHTLKDADTVV